MEPASKAGNAERVVTRQHSFQGLLIGMLLVVDIRKVIEYLRRRVSLGRLGPE